jgi:predicted Zn-dependent protease
MARNNVGGDEELLQQSQVSDTLTPVQLWHDATVRAMTTARGTVIPELLTAVARDGLNATGFLGMIARSEAILTKEGISVYSEETDSELTVTARSLDGKSSGWSGCAARDWSTVRYTDVATEAARFAKQGIGARALEPGRYTAILGPAAVAQLARHLAPAFNAYDTDNGGTPFSRAPHGNKLGKQVFDARVTIRSDPADLDGGYRPYFSTGYATPPMLWVQDGILKNLAYNPSYAMMRGKSYAELPWSLRISGGTTSVEQMIRQCERGIYVNRFSGVESIDLRTGLTTGVTRDGCFLIKNGVIDRPLKNFRFVESPFFVLNKIRALGATARATFGYTPKGERELGPSEWPRRPIIVPPMMVDDFNFATMADAI